MTFLAVGGARPPPSNRGVEFFYILPKAYLWSTQEQYNRIIVGQVCTAAVFSLLHQDGDVQAAGLVISFRLLKNYVHCMPRKGFLEFGSAVGIQKDRWIVYIASQTAERTLRTLFETYIVYYTI